MSRRLVCIVEGKGEVRAIPNLCARIITYIEAWDWFVDPEPIRQPRSRLVDERQPSPSRPARVELGASCPGAAVMAVREYEAWILHGLSRAQELPVGVVESRRDAKGLLRRYRPGYRPSLHQLDLTRQIDIQRCWARSDSFDELVRSMVTLTEVALPERPVAQP